jgi:hypothetical protein
VSTLWLRIKEPSSWASAAAAFGALFAQSGNLYYAGFTAVAALLGFALPEKSK